MNQKFFSIILLIVLVTIIPTVSAQFSLGVEANQKSIEVKLNESEIVNVKHVIGSSGMPVSVNLFDGVIADSIIVTNEEGEEKEIGLYSDGKGNSSITILPSKQNSIIKYEIDDASTLYQNIWTVRIEYSETFSIHFPEKTELVFLNDVIIQLGDKKGISVNGGGSPIVQYYSEIPRTIEKINWEENNFDVEIITNSKIDKFNFDQPSRSINFQINEKNEFVTINLHEELLGGPYVVLLDDKKIQYTKSVSKENYVSLSLNPESTGVITIIGTTVIPEFSMFIPLIMGFLIILTVPFMKKISLH